ncbi:hypothetical protein ACFQ36_04635 [Arthrobacter sp. GCM10027362]|uniref:hypothetical protein n=1 Tax=Arthrobacter sp. GCM10027362 TaxID=3273379 RepID=UPI00363C9C15
MNEEIKQVWAAAACLESLQAEMDQAQAALDSALMEAMGAGAGLDTITVAANLTAPELNARISTFAASMAVAEEAVRSDRRPSLL